MSTYAEFTRRGAAWTLSGGTPASLVTSRLPAYHDGNLALMVTSYNGSGPFAVPSGWTAVEGSPWAFAGATVPPQIWSSQNVMACWKLMSGNNPSASNGPSFALDAYDGDNVVSWAGRIYLFRYVDDLLGETAFPQDVPVLASEFVSASAPGEIRPPQLTDPGRTFLTLTYPSLDAGVAFDHSWMVFSFVHGSHPLVYRDYDNQIKPDPPPTWRRIDPALTGPDAGTPPGTTSGPNDSFDHIAAEGAYFFAYNAGDDVSNTYQTLTPSPSEWDLINRDFNFPIDEFNILPQVGGIVMVVLGGPTTPVAYWGINASTPT